MIEVRYECDTCAKSKLLRHKSFSALMASGQAEGFRGYQGKHLCAACRKKLMGKKKWAQNKKVSESRQQKKQQIKEAREREERLQALHLQMMEADFEERYKEKLQTMVTKLGGEV
mgnify:FL=1